VTRCPARRGVLPRRRGDSAPRAPPGARSPRDADRRTAAALRDHGSQPLDAVLRTPRARRDRSPSSPGDRDRRLGPRAIDPAGRHRPPLAPSDGARPAADRLRRTTLLASTHRRLPPSSARTLQGGADVCGDAGRPTGSVPREPQVSRYPRGTSRPRVSDRSGPGSRRRNEPAGPGARGDRSAVRPPAARDAGRRRSRPLLPVTCVRVDVVVHHPLPPTGGRLPEAPGGARPGQGHPGADRGSAGRDAGTRHRLPADPVCARLARVEGTRP